MVGRINLSSFTVVLPSESTKRSGAVDYCVWHVSVEADFWKESHVHLRLDGVTFLLGEGRDRKEISCPPHVPGMMEDVRLVSCAI